VNLLTDGHPGRFYKLHSALQAGSGVCFYIRNICTLSPANHCSMGAIALLREQSTAQWALFCACPMRTYMRRTIDAQLRRQHIFTQSLKTRIIFLSHDSGFALPCLILTLLRDPYDIGYSYIWLEALFCSSPVLLILEPCSRVLHYSSQYSSLVFLNVVASKKKSSLYCITTLEFGVLALSQKCTHWIYKVVLRLSLFLLLLWGVDGKIKLMDEFPNRE